jgi:uncharacterized protein
LILKYIFPDSALAQHTAVLGKTGSAKTSTAKLAIEQVVAEGARVCVLDPFKSDWWGITSSADGKRAGLPFHILGGPRGHMPLHSSAGKAIGELVATGALPLSIIDMADFEAGGLQRFFVDFAPALLRRMRGVVYLVIEEAHEFAPKERSGIGAENMAIHWAKKLATAGRSKGVRLILITQRTQALHNALLGSCETMIVHRMTAPADQGPVKQWLKANCPKEILPQVEDSLSSLKTGTGWLCSGEAKVFELVAFPRIKTYDNTATPTGDGDALEVKTAPVDQDRLRAIIGTAVKEAEANDPKILHARIVQLERELKIRPTNITEKITADPQAEQRGYTSGINIAIASMRKIVDAHGRKLVALYDTLATAAHDELPQAHVLIAQFDDVTAKLKSGSAGAPTPPPAPTRAATPNRPMQRARPSSSPAPSGDDTLTAAMRETLAALAWWAQLGHDAPTRKQLGAMIGVAPSGSTMRARLAALSNPGLIEYPTAQTVRLTEAGRAAAPAPHINGGLIETIRASLSQAALETFDAIPPAPMRITRDDLGQAINVEPHGSTMRARLAALSNRELIHYPGRMVARQDWVTE